MSTPKNEILLQRIDRLTEGLAPAVSRSGAAGAEFALMLSMVQQAQVRVQELRAAGESAEIEGPVGSRDRLYTPELVGRLGEAMQRGERGELALLVSWLDTVPVKPMGVVADEAEAGRSVQLPLSQAAVLARSYTLLDEIQASRIAVAA